jgi:hypothetical protein
MKNDYKLKLIEILALIIFIYATTSLIWLAYIYFFDHELFELSQIYIHIYGFVVSNIVLLGISKVKNEENET